MGCPRSPTPRMGCRGLFLTCGPPTPGTATTIPTPRTWTPPPQEALAVAGDLSSWDFRSVDQVLWVGKGAVGRVGLWEGGATQALLADAPEAAPAGPPTCPFQPTFLCRSAPSPDLAVMEVAEQGMLFFVGSVHQIEICKGDNVDAESEIHFAMSGVAPPVRPTTLWHLVNIAPVAVAHMFEGWGMVNHMSILLQGVLACVFAFFVGKLDEIHVKFVQISYEFHVNECV